jgi:hypothetical protein
VPGGIKASIPLLAVFFLAPTFSRGLRRAGQVNGYLPLQGNEFSEKGLTLPCLRKTAPRRIDRHINFITKKPRNEVTTMSKAPKNAKTPAEKTYAELFKEILESLSPALVIPFLNGTFRLQLSLESEIKPAEILLEGPEPTGMLKVTEPTGTIHCFHVSSPENKDCAAFMQLEYAARIAVSGSGGGKTGSFSKQFQVPLRGGQKLPKNIKISLEISDGPVFENAISKHYLGDCRSRFWSGTNCRCFRFIQRISEQTKPQIPLRKNGCRLAKSSGNL